MLGYIILFLIILILLIYIKEKEDNKLEIYDKNIDYTIFYYWLGVLNRIIFDTNFRYYIFTEKLPKVEYAEEKVLYCLINEGIYIPSKKYPFFNAYFFSETGTYKMIDINEYLWREKK